MSGRAIFCALPPLTFDLAAADREPALCLRRADVRSRTSRNAPFVERVQVSTATVIFPVFLFRRNAL